MPQTGPVVWGWREPLLKKIVVVLLGIALAAISGCAPVQKMDGIIAQTPSTAVTPRLFDAKGPLTAEQSQAILAKLEAKAGGDILGRHIAVEDAVTESPLMVGNRVRLLPDGQSTFKAIFAAIRNAKHQVNLEYFIFEDVESNGQKLGDLLIAQHQRGVEINVIYDAISYANTPPAFIDRLEKAGINMVEFNPLNPFDATDSPNNRDHRKILVADGQIAIVGGVNLSQSYQSSPLSGAGQVDPKKPGWSDTDIEIEGPVVLEIQKLFLKTWQQQKGPPVSMQNSSPGPAMPGDQIMRVIGSGPDEPLPRYYATLLSAIHYAEKRVWLATAYFVPTEEEMQELIAAARRGVDVRLLLPGVSDSQLSLAVAHSNYEDLLEAGVKIYEVHDAYLHSKFAVIDGVWSSIGSSNIDHRSVLFNDEIDVVILGIETAQQFEAHFSAQQNAATPIDDESWTDRPFSDRIGEGFSRLWEELL
jgi:cardiolipin synthase A/B